MQLISKIQDPFFIVLYVGTFGLFIGSFLNVVIYRLPLMIQKFWLKECRDFLQENKSIDLPDLASDVPKLNLAWPGSHCPACKHPIGILENIPVISYLVQRGRCKHCQTTISIRYLLVELLTAMLSIITVMVLGAQWSTLWALLLTYALIAASFIDYDHKILPDDITLPLLWLGLLINSFSLYTDPVSAIFGAIAGYLSLWTVFQVFRLITGKEGMGYGDFKLLAALGAWLGWQAIPLIVLLSSFVGAVAGISLILVKKHDRANPIPFGPYIAVAGWIALLWGDIIIAKYLQMIAP